MEDHPVCFALPMVCQRSSPSADNLNLSFQAHEKNISVHTFLTILDKRILCLRVISILRAVSCKLTITLLSRDNSIANSTRSVSLVDEILKIIYHDCSKKIAIFRICYCKLSLIINLPRDDMLNFITAKLIITKHCEYIDIRGLIRRGTVC